MILNGIGFIPLIVINIKDLVYNFNKRFIYKLIIYIILNIIRAILYSLEDVFNKIALNKLLFRPYELMFYKAVFEIIPIIIITIITFKKGNISDYYKYNLTGLGLLKRFIYRLFFIIFNIFRTISLITIIEKLNPNHLSILKSSEFIAFFIYLTTWNSINEKDGAQFNIYNFIFELFSCIILLLGSIIHNEIIIINKCGLMECTDYYKVETKGSNVDDNLDNEKDRDTKTKDSLLGESVSQDD